MSLLQKLQPLVEAKRAELQAKLAAMTPEERAEYDAEQERYWRELEANAQRHHDEAFERQLDREAEEAERLCQAMGPEAWARHLEAISMEAIGGEEGARKLLEEIERDGFEPLDLKDLTG